MSKVSRGETGEKIVARILDGIKEPHYLFNDITLINPTSEMTHQIDHILVHPHGLFVIETKNHYGPIMYDPSSGEWFKLARGKLTRISSPVRQNKSHCITLRKAIKSKYVPIPVVVYVKNNAPYLPDDNVINVDDLLLFIDSYPYPRLYTEKELLDMKHLIEGAAQDVSKAEHIENVGIMKKVRKEIELQMAYAIEQGRCPHCGTDMQIRGYDYECPKCGFGFKL